MARAHKQLSEQAQGQLVPMGLRCAAQPGGREGVVRERLYDLLSTLGELPLDVDRPRPWGTSWPSALEAACPPGYTALYGGNLPGKGLACEAIVAGPIGIVVVGHTEEPGRPFGTPRSSGARVPAGGPAPYRPLGARGGRSPVRETLRRALALRAWLQGTRWEGTAVLAGVCSPPVLEHDGQLPLLLDGLWVGAINYLGPWLASAPGTGGQSLAAAGELVRFLDESLGGR